MFKDRFDAGKQLVDRLQHYKNKDGVVIAIPRGGIQTGYEVARALGLPLEVVLSKKLGHPIQKEYAIGAVSLEGRIISNYANVSADYIEAETARIRKLLRNRYKFYYQDRTPEKLTDRIIIIVDDGIATGNTILSTIQLIKKSEPSQIVLAIPVASPRSLRKLKAVVDEIVCLQAPANFHAVGQFYTNFQQVSDDEVVQWLKKAQAEEKTGEAFKP